MLRTVSTATVNAQGRAVQFKFFLLLQDQNLNLGFHFTFLAPAFCAFVVTEFLGEIKPRDHLRCVPIHTAKFW